MKLSQNTKIQKVMREFKEGKLFSHGKKVTDHRQAVAIALSEARKMNEGGEVTTLFISSKNPLSKQLNSITGDSWNAIDFENLDGSEPQAKLGNIFRHKKTGKLFTTITKEDTGIAETELNDIEVYPFNGKWVLAATTRNRTKDILFVFDTEAKAKGFEKAVKKNNNIADLELTNKYEAEIMNEGGKTDKKYIIRVGETYDHSGGEAKVMRTYEQDGVAMVDYIHTNKISKPETQTLRGFITTIQTQYAKGGPIKNQYKRKTAEEIWNGWTQQQRIHFLSDHKIYDKPEQFIRKESLIDIRKGNWDNLPEKIKTEISIHIDNGQYADAGRIVKLTPAKKKLHERIIKLKEKQSKIKNTGLRNAIEKKIAKLQAEFDKKPLSIKEKISAQKGRFYLYVPTEYAKPIYRKLWSMGIKPELYKLNGNTKVVVNHSKKLEKAYSIYADLLSDKGAMVPPLSKIKGKL